MFFRQSLEIEYRFKVVLLQPFSILFVNVELNCRSELVYDSCGTSCPATCLEPEGSDNCADDCIETCRCPEGLLLEGDHCIQPSECGCFLEDGSYLEVSLRFISIFRQG